MSGKGRQYFPAVECNSENFWTTLKESACVLSSYTTLVSQILYLNHSLAEFPTIVYKHNLSAIKHTYQGCFNNTIYEQNMLKIKNVLSLRRRMGLT
jgi:hypothetical protein